MTENKLKVLENICYTELVYDRINKKLHTNLSKKQIEAFLLNILTETNDRFYIKTGKNFYVTNTENNIRITINSYTFRVITVDKIKR
jgi:hypothetical protein